MQEVKDQNKKLTHLQRTAHSAGNCHTVDSFSSPTATVQLKIN